MGQRVLDIGENAGRLRLFGSGLRPVWLLPRLQRLKDPQRILEGKGQYVRHIKVRKVSDIDEDTFRALLRQAAR